jgi:hypothetical protein
MNRHALKALKWFGTALQVVGVFALAGRFLSAHDAYFVLGAGSLAWLAAAVVMRDLSLFALNAAFTASNALGIWSWAP